MKQSAVSYVNRRKQLKNLIAKERREHPVVITEKLLELQHELEEVREKERNLRFFTHGKGRHWRFGCFDAADEDPDNFVSPRFESDNGEGVERIIAEIDGEVPTLEEYRLRFISFAALVAAIAPHALFTLLLILKNRNQKEKSICEMLQNQAVSTRRRGENMSAILKHC